MTVPRAKTPLVTMDEAYVARRFQRWYPRLRFLASTAAAMCKFADCHRFRLTVLAALRVTRIAVRRRDLDDPTLDGAAWKQRLDDYHGMRAHTAARLPVTQLEETLDALEKEQRSDADQD